MTTENDKPRVNDVPKPAKAVGRQTVKAGIGRGVARSGGRILQNASRRGAQVIANMLRQGSRVSTLAIIRGATRIFMANILTAVLTLIAFTLYDSIFFFRKERSGKQLFVDFISNIWVMSWGTSFFIMWETATQGVFEGSVWLSVVGFLAGFCISVIICLIAGVIFDKIAKKFYTSDTDRMLMIIGEEFERNRASRDITEEQAKELLRSIEKLVTPKMVRKMFKSEDRAKFAQELISEAEAALSTGE